MSFLERDITGFADALASGDSVPGGGGAAALVGALGVALGSMVGNLTVNKPRYADVADEVARLLVDGEQIRARLLALIDADAEVFEPLSRAYGIPKDDPTRAAVMEEALQTACTVPVDIMRACCDAIEMLEQMERVGTALAISDVGVGAVCAKAALQGASLNVIINTSAMTDRTEAQRLEDEVNSLLETYCPRADAVYNAVLKRIGG